ncbi:ubiquitin conjugating enzyme E2H isoform X2 [Calliopsis andreniformis]|uniref:ubiquitin conjugating enzyme E2H isoform X2 n=1 Tax=Calliopsis andreniformis TaxID=337506 RepID=UPI003FCEA187
MSSPSAGKRRMDTDVLKLIESKHEVTILGGLNEFSVKFYGPRGTPRGHFSLTPDTVNVNIYAASVHQPTFYCTKRTAAFGDACKRAVDDTRRRYRAEQRDPLRLRPSDTAPRFRRSSMLEPMQGLWPQHHESNSTYIRGNGFRGRSRLVMASRRY